MLEPPPAPPNWLNEESPKPLIRFPEPSTFSCWSAALKPPASWKPLEPKFAEPPAPPKELEVEFEKEEKPLRPAAPIGWPAALLNCELWKRWLKVCGAG